MKRNVIWAIGVTAVIVSTIIVSALVNRSTVRSGPAGSSFVTTPAGAAGLFELLSVSGVDVGRLRSATADLSGVGTLVIVESGLAGFSAPEIAAISRFVNEGGRLVVGGRMATELGDALGTSDRLSRSTPVAEVRVPVGGIDGALELGGSGQFVAAGAALPVAGDPLAAVVHAIGRGVVVQVADSAAFRNDNLEDNAGFLVAIIGRGPVLFDEVRHGYAIRESAGLLGVLPDPVRAALLLGLVPLAAGLMVYGRRMGRPFTIERRFDPARVEFAEAIGAILERTRDPVGATKPTHLAALRLLDEASGLDPAERDAVVDGPDDVESVLIVDRALAKLWKEKQ